MQLIHKQAQNTIKSDPLIIHKMRIVDQRMSKGMNEKFRPPKNLMYLQKILQQKNQKISNQLNENNIALENVINFKRNIVEQIQRLPHQEYEILKKNSYQRDFNTKYFNTTDESDLNLAQNTVDLYRMENQLRDVILQSNLFEMRKRQQIAWGLQWIKIRELPPKEVQPWFKDTKLQLLKNIKKKNDKNIPQKTQNKKKNKKNTLKETTGQKQVYACFKNCFSKTDSSGNQLNNLLDMTYLMNFKKMKFSKQKVFWIFVNVLIKKFLKDKQTDGDLFEATLQLTSQIYFSVYRGPSQFKNHCTRRPILLITGHYKQKINSLQQNADIPKSIQEKQRIQQLESFWVKCLMSFVSYQAAKDKLYQYIRQKGYGFLINALQKFYLKQDIQNKDELKQKSQFSNSYYYRILTKIILNQPLVQSQQVLLSEDEKNIITMIKLRHIPEFHKTMEFKQKQQLYIEKIKQMISQDKDYDLQQTFQIFVKRYSFDHIFWDLILSYREYLQEFQLLLVFRILLSNPNYLRFSVYSQKQWVYKCFQILESFLKKKTILNDQDSLRLLVRIMSVCRKKLNEYQFVKKLQQFLMLRRDLMLLLFEQESYWIKTFTQDFSLDMNCLSKIIPKLMQNNQDYEYFYKKFLSTYVFFSRLQHPTIINTLKNPRINSSIDINTLFTHINMNLFRVHEQQRFQEQIQKLKRKNEIFVLGLKILIRFLFKLTGQQLSEYQTQKTQQYVFQSKYLLQIIFKVVNHIKSFLSNEKQLRSQSQQFHFINQERALSTLLNQWDSLIPSIIQLLEIGNIFRYFVNLNLYFKSENKVILYNFVEYLQSIQKKYHGTKNGLKTFCQNIQKNQIVDQTFGKYLLIKTCQLFKKPIQDIDLRKSRKTSFLAPDFSFHDVQNYVNYLQRVLKQF